MMLSVALILTAVSAVVVAPVAHAVTMTGDAASWARSIQVHVPGPAGPPVAITFGACPGLHQPEVGGCVSEGSIYLLDRDGFLLEHELGHLFDARNLNDRERDYLGKRLGGGAWGSCGDTADMWSYGDCPSERFADAYASCALGLHPDYRDKHGALHTSGWITGYGWNPSRRQHARMCELIRAYA